MKRPDLINKLIQIYDREVSYLEIGVWAGDTFKQINARYKLGVDPYPRFDLGNSSGHIQLLKLTSDTFFQQNKEIFDVCFIDGYHTFDQTLRDFNNCLSTLAVDGIIIIDDIKPESYISSVDDPALVNQIRSPNSWANDGSNSWMGDVYRLAFLIESHYPMIDCYILSETSAQLICWKRSTARDYSSRLGKLSVRDIVTMTYAGFLVSFKKLCFAPLEEIINNYNLAFR